MPFVDFLVKALAFTSKTTRSLPGYFKYLFLRYPGTLGPEESISIEFFDTFDRKWSAQGQIWMKSAGTLRLISPPSLFPLESDPEKFFGLQKPFRVGQGIIKIRSLRFDFAPDYHVDAQVVTAKKMNYLVLRAKSGEAIDLLTTTLTAEGWDRFSSDFPTGLLITAHGPSFLGTQNWRKPKLSNSGVSFLLDRMRDAWRVAHEYEPGIISDLNTECLHHYRVHVRKSRSFVSMGTIWDQTPE